MAFVLTLFLGLLVATDPAPAACPVPDLLPSLPVQPVFSAEGSTFRIDLWRQLCATPSGRDEWAIYARLTPHAISALVCSFATLIQDSREIEAVLRMGGGASLCGQLLLATTFAVTPLTEQPDFDSARPFTLVYADGASQFLRVDVPAAGAPPPRSPSVKIVATGCLTCRAGDRAELRLHFVNPGPDRTVELKFGSRFPDGTTSVLFLGRYVEYTIPSGQSDLIFPSMVLPDLPTGTYVLEAAILDLDFGTTLSRHGIVASFVR
jgi:hypothetical protein